jgi:hypothetical protein
MNAAAIKTPRRYSTITANRRAAWSFSPVAGK